MSKPLQDITILVADDAPLNLMIMRQVLGQAGAAVFTAANGREAIEWLDAQPAHIVLMDLQMPVLDGFAATQAIRYGGQHYSTIPIIAVTAETSPAEVEKCLLAGMNDFISKPFQPQAVYDKILAVLASRKVASDSGAVTVPENLQPAYDLTYLKEISGGDTDNMLLFANNLQENGPILLQQAASCVANGQWQQAAGLLHKLKGLAGLFYMPEVISAITLAETEAKEKEAAGRLVIDKELAKLGVLLPALTQLILDEIKK